MIAAAPVDPRRPGRSTQTDAPTKPARPEGRRRKRRLRLFALLLAVAGQGAIATLDVSVAAAPAFTAFVVAAFALARQP